MTPAALALVLGGSVLHAVWNLIAKRASATAGTGGGATFVALYSIASLVVCVPAGLIELTSGEAWPDARPVWLWGFAVSALWHIAYSVLLQWGYAAGDLNVTYPVSRGFGPLLAMLLAIVVWGEDPSPLAVAGALVIIAGVAIISTGSAASADPVRLRRGLMFGLATGVAIAGYTLWDAYAVAELGIPPVTYFAGALLAQGVVFVPIAVRRRQVALRVARRHAGAVVGVAVLSPAAYIVVLIALQTAPVSLVAPLRATSIMVGGLLSWWLLREANPARRFAGSVVVCLGIAGVVSGG